MANAKWAATVSGDWNTAANRSTGAVPGGPAGSDDVATIEAPGGYAISAGSSSQSRFVASSGVISIGSVTLNASGATLSIAGDGFAVETVLTLNNGTRPHWSMAAQSTSRAP